MAVCVLYKTTGIILTKQRTTKSKSSSIDGSTVTWKNTVTSKSGRWLDPVRPGLWALHVGKNSGVGIVTGNGDVTTSDTSDSLFLLSNQGTAMIVGKSDVGGIVTGNGDVKVPVYENESQE